MSKDCGFKGYTSPICNIWWGFNNLDYQTNKQNNCWSNKQTKQIKVFTFHLASLYYWILKSEYLIIFEDIYKFWIRFELMIVILMECLYKIQLKLTRKQFKLDGRAFSLGFIFSLKCIFGLGFGNIITQTNKL